MKIVVNSDILISAQLFQGRMSRSFSELCNTCRELQVPIVVPKTAMLEHRRRQAEFLGSEIRAIEEAVAVFQRHGINHDEVDLERTIQVEDLIDFIANSGASTEQFDPTFEILAEAHDRACEHRPPTGKSKSDEMRDIVIWLTAVRIARESGGAILVARDGLFHDENANDEAAEVNLIRVKSVEEAVARLRDTPLPGEDFAKLFLVEIRGHLAARGIEIPMDTEAYRVLGPDISRGDRGKLASVRFGVAFSRPNATDFSATIGASFGEEGGQVSLTNVEPNMPHTRDQTITIELDPDLDIEAIAKKAGLEEIVTLGERS